jgi:transcriptional regulator with GAF, ATPase, and Fis domain
MGVKAKAFFDQMEKLGGLPAKMRLASLARVTSAEAAAGPDDDDVLLRLESASWTVRRAVEGGRDSHHPVMGPRAELDALRRQLEALRDLAAQRRLFLSDVTATARRVDETAAHVLGVERVSVWFLDPRQTKISCIDLFQSTPRKHGAGVELFARDFAPYFEAMLKARTIAAHDAQTDPRTSCFTESYLKPLGITSMLDVPLWVGEEMVGVLCHEHVGAKRVWSVDEESFAYLVSTYVSLALERARLVAPAR